jgi:hypothetical protein
MPAPSEGALYLPANCESDTLCTRLACFQARVEGTDDDERFGKRSNACGSHLGDLVQSLKAWALSANITEGWLTVVAFDPAAECWERVVGDSPDPGAHFTFSTVPIQGHAVVAD